MYNVTPQQFFEQSVVATYVFSPAGDRPDTFRHMELIGMNTLPVTDLSEKLYGGIYGNSMVFMKTETLFDLLNGKVNIASHVVGKKPNRDLVTLHYWRKVVAAAVAKSKSNCH